MRRFVYLAWLVSLGSFFGSLYFGEVAGMELCRLCWYQRICMFPLVYFLGLSVYKDDILIAKMTLPLVFLGGVIAYYQVLIQNVPSLQWLSICKDAFCTLPGPLPFLSAIAFTLIAIFILLLLNKKKGTR